MTLKLVVIGGKQAGMEIPISKPEYRIGRGGDCHLRPQNPLVSRRHCIISIDNGLAAIEDCGSGNGTFLNGVKLQWRRQLQDTDRIKIGTLEFEFRLDMQGEMQGSAEKTVAKQWSS
jgi:sigma-B regulation protein RsbU (phosphoserine phosphatase)